MIEDLGRRADEYVFPRYRFLAGLFLVWFVALSVQGRAWQALSMLGALGSAALFCASCIAVGQFVLRNVPASIVLRLTTGLVVMYFLAFFLGLLHGYFPLLLSILAYAPAALLLRRSVLARLEFARPFILSRQELLPWLIAIAVGCYCFLLWQTPVTHYDALTNHLAIPAEYLSRSGIESIPYNLHANLPPASHMVYLFLIAASGPQSVQAFHFLLLLFIALAFRDITGKDSSSWLYAFVLFALIPQVSLLLSLTSIDFLATLFCVVSFFLCMRALQGEPASLPLALHLGFLCALKYQSVLFVGLLLVVLAVRVPKRAVLVGCGVLLLSLPFILKNYFLTADPVFPFATEKFGVSEEDRREAQVFVSANSHMPDDPALADYARTFYRSFTRLPEAGVLPLLLLVSAIFVLRLQFRFKYLLLVFAIVPVAAHSLLSLNVVNVMRWVQYSFAFLCLLAGICFAERRKKTMDAVFALCVVASFLLGYRLSMQLTQAVFVGTGRVSVEEYRIRFIPSFNLREQVKHLNGKVLFLGESRAFYNAENSIIPSDYDFLYLARYFHSSANSEELRSAFRADGVQYLFLNTQGITEQLRSPRFEWLRGNRIRMLQELTARSRIVAQDSTSLVFDIASAQQSAGPR